MNFVNSNCDLFFTKNSDSLDNLLKIGFDYLFLYWILKVLVGVNG